MLIRLSLVLAMLFQLAPMAAADTPPAAPALTANDFDPALGDLHAVGIPSAQGPTFASPQDASGLRHRTIQVPTQALRDAVPGLPSPALTAAGRWWIVICDVQGNALDASGRAVTATAHPALLFHPDRVLGPDDPVLLFLDGRLRKGQYFRVAFQAPPTAGSPGPDQLRLLPFDAAADQITLGQGLADLIDQPNYSVSPTPVYQQGLDSGGKRNVLHLELKGSIPVLFPNQKAGNFQLSSDNTLSSEYNDFASRIGAKLTFRRTDWLGGTSFLNLDGDLHYLANQSFRNQAVGTGLSVGTALGPLAGPFAPYLVLTPLQYERRFKLDPAQTPHHTRQDLLDPSAELRVVSYLEPFRPDMNPSNARNITLSAKGWWFPNESARGGYSVSRLEGRVQVKLNQPLRWGVIQMLSLSYSAGANDANGFADSSSVGLSLTAFGRDFSLYQY